MTENSPPSNVNVSPFSAEVKKPRVPLGYTKLAGFMVKHDLEMFRRFRKLAVRDILYLQAELCHLDYQFQDQALRDANGGHPEKYFDREWWQLKKSGGRQWEIALEIRAKLKEYYSAISDYQNMEKLRIPSCSHRALVFDWIDNDSLGGQCEFLGRDLADYPCKSVFHEDHHRDIMLVGDMVENETNLVTKLIAEPAFNLFHKFYHRFKKPEPRDEEHGDLTPTELYHYNHRGRRLLDFMYCVVSPLLPVIGIVCLTLHENLQIRLALVGSFTFMFSLALFLFTKSRNVEVFTSTAAFASVMVVFVGTAENLDDKECPCK